MAETTHNFRIEPTDHYTFQVRADSQTFGKDAIIFESPKRNACVDFISDYRGDTDVRYYIIPDMMTWADNGKSAPRTPIEYYSDFRNAANRFHTLKAEPYNQERRIIPDTQEVYPRLTFGVSWETKAVSGTEAIGSMDVIQVREGKNYLVTDFMRMYNANTNRDILSALHKIEHELGYEYLRVPDENGKFQTLESWMWTNDYFPDFIVPDVLYRIGDSHYLHIHSKPDFFEFTKYDPNTAEILDEGEIDDNGFLEMLDVVDAVTKTEDEHVIECTDRLEGLLRDAAEYPVKREEPLYRHSLEHAKTHGEEELYRKSMNLNLECAEELNANLLRNYDSYWTQSLAKCAAPQILAQYGIERVRAVLASMILIEPIPDTYSEINRKWAADLPIERDEEWAKIGLPRYRGQVLNDLVDQVRLTHRERERQKLRSADRAAVEYDTEDGKQYVTVERIVERGYGRWRACLYGQHHERLRAVIMDDVRNALGAINQAELVFWLSACDAQIVDFQRISELIQNREAVRTYPVEMRSLKNIHDAKEVVAYFASHALNRECRNFLEECISQCESGYIDRGTGKRLIAVFGEERVTAVLSNLVQHSDDDSRYAPLNKLWAKKCVFPDDECWKMNETTSADPVLLNQVIHQVREEQTEAHSLSGKLAAARKAVQEHNSALPNATVFKRREQSI